MPTPTTLKVFTAEYTVEDDVAGIDGESPVVHLFGRDVRRQWYHVPVTHFWPYFCAPTDEVRANARGLADDERVRTVTHGEQSYDPNEPALSKVVCQLPKHVGQFRDVFENPYEDDVLFSDRIQIDTGIAPCCTIDADISLGRTQRVHCDDVQGTDDQQVAHVEPRICTVDIEVRQGGDGPSVVSESGIEQARNPVTAVTLHDSYPDEYYVHVLCHPDWTTDRGLAEDLPADVTVGGVETYRREDSLLEAVCDQIADWRPDVFTAWNVGFDAPYFVNRCIEQSVPNLSGLSPLDEVRSMPGDGTFINSNVSGMMIIDLIDAYKKTEYRQSQSYSLKHIANEVLEDTGKLDVPDIDAIWESDPSRFVRYNLVDTQAANEIRVERGVF